jgi:hypothetical protein
MKGAEGDKAVRKVEPGGTWKSSRERRATRRAEEREKNSEERGEHLAKGGKVRREGGKSYQKKRERKGGRTEEADEGGRKGRRGLWTNSCRD